VVGKRERERKREREKERERELERERVRRRRLGGKWRGRLVVAAAALRPARLNENKKAKKPCS